MKKIIMHMLLISSCITGAHAYPHNFFKNSKHLSIPQTLSEKKEGIKLAHSLAKTTSFGQAALASLILGGLGYNMMDLSESDTLQKIGFTSLALSIPVGIGVYNFVYPENKKSELAKYQDYAPLNDRLQIILRNASTYNFHIIDTAQSAQNINEFLREISIESINQDFPVLNAYNELAKMLRYLESSEQELTLIVHSHGELSLFEKDRLYAYIQDSVETQRLVKEIMTSIKFSQLYKEETTEKRRVQFEKAELSRINAEIRAASERAKRDKAQAEKARQEANLASAQTTQAWVNLVTEKPKSNNVSIYL